MSEARQQQGHLREAWLVILLALLYGGALAGVQTTLGPVISENKRNEAYSVIPILVGGADKAKTVEVLVDGKSGRQQTVYQANAADGAHRGWVLPASGQGFAGRIDLLVGLDRQVSTITGIYVLDQKETPGLGNLIASQGFRDQWIDKSADQPLVVVKSNPLADSNQIRALSGATISSESVATIVNEAIADFKEPIQQLEPAAAPGPKETSRESNATEIAPAESADRTAEPDTASQPNSHEDHD